jgi:hypothetical protein
MNSFVLYTITVTPCKTSQQPAGTSQNQQPSILFHFSPLQFHPNDSSTLIDFSNDLGYFPIATNLDTLLITPFGKVGQPQYLYRWQTFWMRAPVYFRLLL